MCVCNAVSVFPLLFYNQQQPSQIDDNSNGIDTKLTSAVNIGLSNVGHTCLRPWLSTDESVSWESNERWLYFCKHFFVNFDCRIISGGEMRAQSLSMRCAGRARPRAQTFFTVAKFLQKPDPIALV
jgi:hypothetical protein